MYINEKSPLKPPFTGTHVALSNLKSDPQNVIKIRLHNSFAHNRKIWRSRYCFYKQVHYCEVREKTNKIQLLDVYYQYFLNMFRASLCPSSGEQDVLLHVVCCAGSAGCGW